MTIRFDIYSMAMRERAAAALTSLGFVEDRRRGYTLQIAPDRRLHAMFASDGLEVHCDQIVNNRHRNVANKRVRPTCDAIKRAIARSSVESDHTSGFP